MKRTQIAFALILGLVAATTGSLQAQPANPAAVRTALHRIEENAQAARDNATLYQWKRVNNEVDRLVAAEKSVEKALSAETAQKESVTALQEAVRELRQGRLNHDVERIKASSERVLTIVDTLIKANS